MTTAIILAGGLGTRLRETVPDLPKPMAPINGRPFLEYQMAYWIDQGVDNFILSVGYKYETIIEHFGSSWKGISIKYVVEQVPLGTGGGLLLAAEGLDSDFLVLNGDTYFEVELKELMEFHVLRQSDWTFSLFRTNEVERYMGMDISNNGAVSALQSSMIQPGRLANGGVYLLSASILSHYQNNIKGIISLEDDVLPDIYGKGSRLFGVEQYGNFIDIGVPEDYLRASEVCNNLEFNLRRK